jgi:hypothetical protein
MTEIRFSATESSFLLTVESDGSGDYLVAISAETDGFKGHADGHVAGSCWTKFSRELVALNDSRKGEAKLESAFPGEFSVRIGAANRRGHMSVSGTLGFSRGEWPRQCLEFGFEFDPTQLGAIQPALQADGPQ